MRSSRWKYPNFITRSETRSHKGELAPLAELVSPDVAVVLNVLPAHIGNFPDMQALTKEKLSIASGLRDDGILILPSGLSTSAANSGELSSRVITFGGESGADVHGKAKVLNGISHIRADVCGTKIAFDLPYTEEHRLSSALAALAVLHALDVNLDEVQSIFSGLQLLEGRGRSVTVNGITIIDDSYNANPVSMEMAIKSLIQSPVNGRKIALLGEMLELGEASLNAHEQIGIACTGLDHCCTFGDGFRSINSPVQEHTHFDGVQDFDTDEFVNSLAEGDVVLIKGSNKVFWINKFTQTLIERVTSL